jgi:FixJ family two-component response regulator
MLKAPIIGIIDDDESVREATKGLIRSLGYNAAIFASISGPIAFRIRRV